MSAETEVTRLQNTQVSNLVSAAKSFLRTGLNLLETVQTGSDRQVAVANLAASVELMLKARLGALSLGLLYVDLPIELRLILSNPSAVPDSYAIHRWFRLIETGRCRTAKAEYCIGAWCVYSGDAALPKAYLTRVAELRDKSLHGLLPALDHYELSRVAYTAVMTYKALCDQRIRFCNASFLTEQDGRLCDDFPKERVERFHRKMAAARKSADQLGGPVRVGGDASFEEWYTECPVCGSDASLYGDCEYEQSGFDFESGELYFVAETLVCPGCELELDDAEEFQLADVEVTYDREDDKTKWLAEHGYYDHEPDYDEYRDRR